MTKYLPIIFELKIERVLLFIFVGLTYFDIVDLALVAILYWQTLYIYNFVSFKNFNFEQKSILNIIYTWLLIIGLIAMYLHFTLKIEVHDLFVILILASIGYVVFTALRKLVDWNKNLRLLILIVISILVLNI